MTTEIDNGSQNEEIKPINLDELAMTQTEKLAQLEEHKDKAC